MSNADPHPPFYGQEVYRDSQQEYIQNILKKYRKEPANEKTKEKIWNELQAEKHAGNIIIPFKLMLRKDPTGNYPDQIDVILDTKV